MNLLACRLVGWPASADGESVLAGRARGGQAGAWPPQISSQKFLAQSFLARAACINYLAPFAT